MKAKLLILLLFCWSASFGQSVPNTNTFTVGRVMLAVYGDSTVGRNTATIFADSNAAYFDATYGSKTMSPQTINGFRNYGSDPCTPLTVGCSYQGGIVAYIFVYGDAGYVGGQTHGLIAAPSDQSTGIQWYNGSYTTTGVNGTAIGLGYANTNAIVASQGAGTYAAQLCDDLSLGGYTDWWLPSKDEMLKVWNNRALIGGFNDGGVYWTSSEYDSTDAWETNYTDQRVFIKNATEFVRAIRSF